MAANASKFLIKEVNYSCPFCEKKHKVEVYESGTKALVKKKPVEYKEIFYFCPKCKEEFYPDNIMDNNLNRARDSYKKMNGLLTSSEIKEIRNYYKLNQKEFANLFGWGDITIQRYESKCIQDETYDEIIRRAKDDPQFVYKELKRHRNGFTEERFKEIEVFLIEIIKKIQVSYLKKEELKALYVDFDKPNVFNGNKILDLDTTEQMLRFFSQYNNNLYKVKLMKLIWYADVQHFKKKSQSITGLVYKHMPYGALPIGYDELLLASDNSISVKEEYFGYTREGEEKVAYKIENVKKVNQNKLKPSEIAILEEVNNFFKNMGSGSISKYMHDEVAYKETENGEIISYELALKIRDFK
jgi:putative zinc finger/helix-turn-helix YgiT family protein